MALRRAVRLVVAGALACLLSACWMSGKPLLTGSNASIVPFAGKYHGEDGGEMLDIEIVSNGGKDYTMTDGKDPAPARFLALRDGWYLIQFQASDDNVGDPPYLFDLLKTEDGELRIYGADCDDTPSTYKGMKRDGRTCEFTRFDGLKAAALGYIERIEKGGRVDGPAVLKPVGP